MQQLDLVVLNGKIVNDLCDESSTTWVIVGIDGCSQPISTNAAPLIHRTLWNNTLSFVIPPATSNKPQYLYITLMKATSDNQTSTIGRCRIRLANLTLDGIKKFKLNLQSAIVNKEREVATIVFQGLSRPYIPQQPSYSPQQMMQAPVPPQQMIQAPIPPQQMMQTPVPSPQPSPYANMPVQPAYQVQAEQAPKTIHSYQAGEMKYYF